MNFARLAAVLVVLLAAVPRSTAQCTGPNCHSISGSISDATTGPLLAGHTYVATGALEVASGATLTVQPGAIIKSASWINIFGNLLAEGTVALPIILTSTRDDTAGGDTNGDGSATLPGKGNWYGIRFFAGSGSSRFENIETRFTGAGSSPAIIVAGSAPGLAFDRVTCKTGFQEAVKFQSGTATVSRLHADDMGGPAEIRTPSEAIHFTQLTTANCDTDGLVIKGNSSITSNLVLTADNLANGTGSIVSWGTVTAQNNVTVTLEAGVTLKFGAARVFQVQGTLLTNGTVQKPVVFTSIDDNAFGGVTGTGTPSANHWGSVFLTFTSANSVLRRTLIRYGGMSEQSANIRADGTVWLDACTIEKSASVGFRVVTTPTVTNCQFLDNAGSPTTTIPISSLAQFAGNTASGNGGGNVMLISGTLTASATLQPASAFNGTGTFVMTSSIVVPTAFTWTLGPGVIVKVQSGTVSVPGKLVCNGTAGNEVIFTSVADDSVGGDTNGDGSATSPVPGSWGGLSLYSSLAGTELNHVVVRYAGGSGSVGVANAPPTMRDCRIEFGSGPALNAGGTAPLLVRCAFDSCGGLAPIVNLNLDALAGLEACTAAGNATTNSVRIAGTTISGIDLDLTPANTLNGDGVLILDGDISVQANASLTVAAGMIWKFASNYRLEVRGPFTALGEVGNEVVFTGITDDIGGDSDGNGGPPSNGVPGSWRNIAVISQTNVTMLNTRIRNAGAGGISAINLFAAGGTFDSIVVEDCTGPGFVPSYPTFSVTNSAFNRCTRPIDVVPVAALGSFSGNTAAGNTLGNAMRIMSMGTVPVGGFSFTPQSTLNEDGVFFINTNLFTQGSEVMKVSAGVVLKFMHPAHSVTISGVLDVKGTSADPVVFTSIHDDEFGGADNLVTPPAPGDWRGFIFQANSDASVIDHAIIRYAGSEGSPTIDLFDADITLSNVVIEFGAGVGIDTNGTSVPTLTNVDIENNVADAIEGLTWPLLAKMSGVTATGNGGSLDATVIDSSFVKGEVVIEKDNVFGTCIVVNISPAVSTINTLSFGRGVIVKAGHPGVVMPVKNVDATGTEKTVFTSLLDDEYGGDTNGDGAASQPTPGDWIGLTSGGTIDHALVRYAGAVVGSESAPGIAAGTSGSITSTRVEFCAGDGVVADDCHNVVAFSNAGIGIGGYSAINCTAALNGEVGIWADQVIYCVSWHNGPTLTENYFEVGGPIIGCPPCACDVRYSIGTTLGLSGPVQGAPGFFGCPNTGWGNLFVDPLFVDELGGDLRLRPNSPARNFALAPISQTVLMDTNICKPWGISGTLFPDAPATSRDHFDNPRRVDDQLIGWTGKVADIGAYERVLWRMEVDGDAELGKVMQFRVEGPSGTAVILVGFPTGGNDAYLSQWNWLMIDPTFYLTLAVTPVNVPWTLPLPLDASLHGLELAFQAGVTPSSAPNLHSMTNVFDARLHL